jgi:L-fucose isomerase-like protein
VLGIIALAKVNHQKEEITRMLEYYRDRFGKEETIDAIIPDKVLFDENEIASCAKDMEKNGADLIVFIVGTWIFSSIVVAAVNDLNTPFILYGLSDQIANGNLGASLQIRYVLQEMKKNFLYLVGPSKDEENIAEIMKYLRAAWVRKYIRNKKIATIGGKCMMMYQTQVNEFNWKRVFGIDFPQYDSVQVFKEMENVPDSEAKKIEKELISRVDKVNWEVGSDKLEKDAIFTQAKMYLAFKRLKELYNIDVFANKCMPEMSAIPYGYGYAACLATCLLNEDNIITACEADVPAGISMYMLNLMTGGQKVFFADIARLHKDENKLTFFNCGTAPLSMADRSKPVEIFPIPGNIADEALPEAYYIGKMKGACINLVLEENKEVTLMRLGGNDETLRMHVASAKTCARKVEAEEIIGQRWPGFGLEFKGDMYSFLANTTGHHYSIVFGNWVDHLRYLSKIYGIKFDYFNGI